MSPAARSRTNGRGSQVNSGKVTELHPSRWSPDAHLVDAAIGGRVRYDQLPESDRAWLIAQLSHRGHHNDLIATWLRCSKRSIQNTRAHPVYSLTAQLLSAEAAADRKPRTPATSPDLLALVHERDRLRDQRDRLIRDLDAVRRNPNCPPPVIILRPTHTPRRRIVACSTLPLFEIGETA